VDGASRSAFDDTSASSSARWRLCCLALIPSLGHGGDRCIGSGGGWGRVFNPDRPDRFDRFPGRLNKKTELPENLTCFQI
jgi:hypothetical protein